MIMLIIFCLCIVASATVPKLQLAIVDFSNRQSEIMTIVEQNHRDYCSRHNYTYVHGHDMALSKGRTAHWSKITLIQQTLSRHEWVLWLDSDTVFIDMSISLESILTDFVQPVKRPDIDNDLASVVNQRGWADSMSLYPSFFFSGDTNVINSGVMLFRRSNWTIHMLETVWDIGTNEDKNPKIGMGLDNAAFAMFLGGCTGSSPYSALQACYSKMDVGWNSKVFKRNHFSAQLRSADINLYYSTLGREVFPHVHPIPQQQFNDYVVKSAKFIFHAAGYPEKHYILKEALSKMKS